MTLKTPPVISMDAVSFAYNGRTILKDVRLTIQPLEFVSIVGPNGGGKSTLLKLLLGLLQPLSGSIEIFGLSPAQARPRIGYVPQNTLHDLRFPITTLEVVLLGRLGTGYGFWPFRSFHREKALHALAQVGLEDLFKMPYANLSGGQRQRVLIARALSSDPECLLLDEPTANLDGGRINEFYSLLEQLNAKQTILLVSHDIGFVSQKVKSVVCVNQEVVLHPTSELTGDLLRDLYGTDIRLVRHDHRCSEAGHQC